MKERSARDSKARRSDISSTMFFARSAAPSTALFMTLSKEAPLPFGTNVPGVCWS